MGDRDALAEVFQARYDEFKACAMAALRRERIDHTLQATAVVHEAWLRLARSDGIDLDDPAALRGLVATVMRHLLVDHARARNGPRRGEGWRRIPLGEATAEGEAGAIDLLDLDDALESLREIHPRQAQVVESRLFGGLTHEESARRLHVSVATVELDWKLARHWLQARLRPGLPP